MAAPSNERIASLEVELREARREITGLKATAYGTQGNGGLQGDVRGVMDLLQRHMQDCGKAHDRTAILLVGEKGDAGLVADVRSLKTLVKALGIVAAALVAETVRRVVSWLSRQG